MLASQISVSITSVSCIKGYWRLYLVSNGVTGDRPVANIFTGDGSIRYKTLPSRMVQVASRLFPSLPILLAMVLEVVANIFGQP